MPRSRWRSARSNAGGPPTLAIRDGAGLIGYGDIVFARARLVIEIDGWAFHSDQERFQRDRSRQNRLVAAGWTVLRFTWSDLKDRPEAFVAAIRTALMIAGWVLWAECPV
jgi:hypothetical protein